MQAILDMLKEIEDGVNDEFVKAQVEYCIDFTRSKLWKAKEDGKKDRK